MKGWETPQSTPPPDSSPEDLMALMWMLSKGLSLPQVTPKTGTAV